MKTLKNQYWSRINGGKVYRTQSGQLRDYVACVSDGIYYKVTARSIFEARKLAMKIGENRPPNTERPPFPGQPPKKSISVNDECILVQPLTDNETGTIQVFPVQVGGKFKYKQIERVRIQRIAKKEALLLIGKNNHLNKSL